MNIQCPACASRGEDNSGDNMKVYPDGHGYCHKCGHYEHKAGEPSKVKQRKSSLTISQVQTYPFGTDPNRTIPQSVAELYGVRYAVDTETGQPCTIYYPHLDETGTVVAGYKVRNLPKEFDVCVGKIGGYVFGTGKKTKNVLVITEGEEDALAGYVMVGSVADVISCANGVNGKVTKEFLDNSEMFEKYNRIFVVMDNDKVGQKHAESLCDWLASFVKDVRNVNLDPEVGKDPSDYLTKGRTAEFKSALNKAPVYEPEGVVNGEDIDLDFLLQPLEEGAPLPFAGLQDKLHGLRKAEITTVCAGSGIGKSTLCREITLSLIKQGYSVANVALEDQMQVSAQALIALDMNTPLSTFRFSPPTKEEVRPHYNDIVANGNTFFYKHFAGITADSLMNKMYYYARNKQVDYIVLDHLSLVISGSDSQNERKDIDNLMTELAKMVVETGVGLLQIVHLKRTGGEKSFAKGGEVELTDLRGSAALEQLSWNVIGVERDQQGDTKDFSNIRVLKNRLFGFTGLADTIKFDSQTGRMKSVPREVVADVESTEIPNAERKDQGVVGY